MGSFEIPTDPAFEAQLSQLEQAETAIANGASEADAQATAQPGDRGPKEGTETDQPPEPAEPKGTPATEESPVPPDEPEQAKPEAPAKGPDGKFISKEAKDHNRRVKTWTELNAEKAAIAKAREEFAQQQAELAEQRKQLERERQQQQGQVGPEAYAKFAGQKQREARALRDQADDLRDEAAEHEADGNYEEARDARARAKALRQQAVQAAETSDRAQAKAEELRKAPATANGVSNEAEYQAAFKHWGTKTAMEYPRTIINDTDENKRYQALIREHPDASQQPEALWFLARLATAESSAARVTKADQEAEALRAEVKKLNGKLSISADGVAAGSGSSQDKPDSQMSDAELEADIRRNAGRE